jgi:hypothetical protein
MDAGPARFAAHPGMTKGDLDRFVAFAPRDDGG